MLYKGVSKVNGESYIGNLVVMGHNFFIRNQNSTSYDDKYIEVFEDSLSRELMKGIFENDIIICDGVKEYAGLMAIIGCLIVLFVSILEENKISVRDRLYKAPLLIRWGVYTFVIVLILFSCTRVGETGGFMYANF